MLWLPLRLAQTAVLTLGPTHAPPLQVQRMQLSDEPIALGAFELTEGLYEKFLGYGTTGISIVLSKVLGQDDLCTAFGGNC